MRVLAFGAALAASGLIVTMGGTAAHADIGILNDKSIQHGNARASYTDATDNLCARTLYTSSTHYAVAYIKRADGSTFASVRDTGATSSATCTGNLSIPEDASYYLQVADCIPVSNPTCTYSAKYQFYS
ncbi:hypothetical protein OG984_04040 [Nocardioides sp. NBC_00368]|uniref:hypothetical protein n=2 Tax=Nocardioides TaxID=1839 RepID=UPI002E1D448C